MNTYKVTPNNLRYTAPYFFVNGKNKEEAEKNARLRSGLARFNSWIFILTKIK